MYIGYCNQGPGVIVSQSNGCQPCCFGGKAGHGMAIADGLFDAGELIDIEYGMLLTLNGCVKVIADSFRGWYDVFRVQRFCATR